MKSALLEVLRGCPYLHLLVDAVDDLISADGATSIDWFGIPAGTVLFHEGDESHDAYVLLSGRLGVFVDSADATSSPIAAIAAGEFVGEMGLISDAPRSATVIALRDSDLLRLPKDTMQQLVQSHPEVATWILQLLTVRLRHTSRTRELSQSLQVIAIVPLASPILDGSWLEQLVGALRTLSPLEVVTRETASREDELQRANHDKSLLVYVADAAHVAWTRHCIRQADHVMFVAEGAGHFISEGADHVCFAAKLRRTADLVLIHSNEQRTATGATPWLALFAGERVLHARARNAADYSRIARLTCRKGIGIVFSGGGARAFAHVGVAQALSDCGIPLDLVGGTSMGSIIGSLVASELPLSVIATKLRHAFVESTPYNDYTFPLVSLARGRKMKRLLQEHCGDVLIENLWRTFFCISANLSSGTTMVHKSGLLWRALRASVGIPGIYPPWVENGEILVDGGIMLNFPTTTMASFRRGLVIGVEVVSEATFRAGAAELEDKSLVWLFFKGRKQVPSIIRTLVRSSMVNGEAQSAAGRAAADILIRPDVGSIPVLSFKAFEKAIEAGYQAGIAAVPQTKRLLAELNIN